MDNVIAVLERSDRVCRIYLMYLRSSDLEIFLAEMQQPFSELTHLKLHAHGETVPIIPDSLLGGSALRLESLMLEGIPFPGFPKLILSATHLDTLCLEDIPHSGYISPEAMVTALSALTGLEELSIRFQSPRSCPDQESRRLPPSTRSVLPVLTSFTFKGVTEYLEDLVASIDAPQLNALDITFFNDIVFDTPQFIQFISRTPTSRALEEARIIFWNGAASTNFSSRTSGHGKLNVKTLCRGLDWQVSSLEQVCTSCLPPLSTSEVLYIYERPHLQLDSQDDIENGPWQDLLRSFAAVKNLFISKELAPRIVPALQELVEGRTLEVFPTLQSIFLEGLESSGPVQEGIEQLVAARQAVGHPIVVSRWANPENEKFY